ncbi:hypothetical protein K504DRAFT_496420 [Pleomassaria siparia CBS 279.74]|uniref:Uncharacterized protein n=1 Tax=Pleomassaria siparia CBS 279.74 TaxID=1314801 RepID=A0A6G1KNS4_9PLEO|nr:hypothetical protein K504DRAFT_496420 [Pleomassaria siparia CBS 279.74]
MELHNDFRQFCDAVRKGDVAKRETISRELYPKLLDNLTTQGPTGLGKAETPPRSPTPKPAVYTHGNDHDERERAKQRKQTEDELIKTLEAWRKAHPDQI